MTAVPMDRAGETLGGVIGQWAGRIIGGVVGEIIDPAGGGVIGAVIGGKVGQWAGAAAGKAAGAYMAQKMDDANKKVEKKTKPANTTEASSSCPPPQERQKKVTKPKQSGKEKADDVPSWAKGERPYVDENGKDFAKRLMDQKYGEGNYDKGPTTDFNRIQKWGDRNFTDPPNSCPNS